MTEYISKNRVKDYIHATNSTHGFTSYEDYVWLLDAVINAPAANVQPIRRGRWYGVPDGLNDDIMCCSECKRQAYWDADEGQQLFDYCPYCGARMDLKEESE